MAGVMIAEVKHARMMLAAIAPPIPLVTPVKRRGGHRGPCSRAATGTSVTPAVPCEPATHRDRTPCAPPLASRKYHACRALRACNA